MYLTPKFDGVIQYGLALSGTPGPAAQYVTGNVQIAEFLPNDGVSLVEVSFLVTTTISSSAGVVLTFYNRPIAGIAGNDTSLGTLTLPSGAVAGTTVYRKVSETSWTIAKPGSLVCKVTTDASSAGAGIVLFKCGQTPENVLNMTSGTAVTG